uniref:Phytocyanin domain-containing protein n=1 Tax=Physcomitrium patens TaxID=3218 RepID=A0A2K1KCA8_PHYPA|nr:hypothetical protein PHYPA_010588 [Physcomitrium patens]
MIVVLITAAALAMAAFSVAHATSHAVGGTAGWTYGFDYADWANSTSATPGFFDNDVLRKKPHRNCNLLILLAIPHTN